MAYDPNQFSDLANKAIQSALNVAQTHQHIAIQPVHLASVLFDESTGVAASICSKANVNIDDVRTAIRKYLKRLPSQNPPPNEIGASQTFMRVLNKAQEIRKTGGDSHVTVDHLLQALYEDKEFGDVLSKAGLTKTKLLAGIKAVRGGAKVTSASAEQQYEALEKYGQDLVKDAENGKLDPVIGRDSEIRRVIQILSRRTKNNPVRADCAVFLDEVHRLSVQSAGVTRTCL